MDSYSAERGIFLCEGFQCLQISVPLTLKKDSHKKVK